MALLQVIILLAVVLGLAFVQVPVILWTIVVAATLLVISIFGHLNIFFLVCCWLLFAAAAIFANHKTLRRRYFTRRIIEVMSQRMPTISNTEREAIEAGNVWWEKDLFRGRPEWKKLLAIPKPKLSSEEQHFIDNEVNTLCSMVDDWQIINQDRDLPENVWNYLKQQRFFGMAIPKEYGGRGFSALGHSTAILKIATRSVSAAVNTMVPNSLGPGELLVHYGTKEQKEYYLPRLAKGEEIPCFALTGPEAGSDAGSITDTGIVCRGNYQGEEIIGIRLNWDKRYITLAPVATVLGVAFRLYDPEKLLNKKTDLGITLCLIPTSEAGVEIGNRHLPLHLAFMNGPTRGKDVFVPLDWIIGGVEMAGQGWRMLMECLSIGRSISLPALSTACGKLTYRATGAYARLRRQFNTSIANFEGVEEALGDIAGSTYLLEACRMMTAGAVDLQIKPAIASAIAKYNMTELGRKVVDHAMDIHGGHGIQVGPRNFLAHAYIAIPVCITVEGANILTRNLIIFGQGAIRCHPYILQEVELFAAPDSTEKTKKLDGLLLSHIGYIISNFARNLCYGLTGGKLIHSPISGPIARCYRQLTRMSAALALLSDMVMLILGGNLKRKERISARLGDMLSQLYLASAVLKYYQDHDQPADDVEYVKWCVDKCLANIQVACDELLHNFPIPALGKLFRWIIFPFGTAYKRPTDALYHKIVRTMLEPSSFRERLTKYIYLSPDSNDAVQRIETAFQKAPQAELIWKKFQIALRNGTLPKVASFEDQVRSALKADVLTDDEAVALTEFDALRREVIKVDEFSFDLNSIVS